jgi:hypothetical protein
MRKYCVPDAARLVYGSSAGGKTRNVVLIISDGLRREVFRGRNWN